MNLWLILAALGCVVAMPLMVIALGRAAAAEPPAPPVRDGVGEDR